MAAQANRAQRLTGGLYDRMERWMAPGRTRKRVKTRRTVAALIAMVACLLQGLIAFGSFKAQAWSLDDTKQGVVVLLLMVAVLFVMVMAAVAMLVSPETAAVLGAVAVALALVVVLVVAPGTASDVLTRSLANAAFFLAAPLTVLGLGTLVARLEGGRLVLFR
jgi:lysylphosphatidylglycerol synthetase-like protein (DUF2156 family)